MDVGVQNLPLLLGKSREGPTARRSPLATREEDLGDLLAHITSGSLTLTCNVLLEPPK